jgi:hypothetical protein
MDGTHGVCGVGREFSRTCDSLYGDFLPLGRASGSRQVTARKLSLQQQETLTQSHVIIQPLLAAAAAVRSSQGILDLIETGALERMVGVLYLATSCRAPLPRVLATLAAEGICSAAAYPQGAEALLACGGIGAVSHAMKTADPVSERGLIECGSTGLGNVLSHYSVCKDLNTRATDVNIYCLQ